MRPVAPRIKGGMEITIAEEQLEYEPITASILDYGDGNLQRVCRWTFTPQERARIDGGEDIYFITPASIQLTPHSLRVGFP
jgi:hypothetical protein